MSRFAKKAAPDEPTGPSVPMTPEKCDCFGCDNDKFIAMALCRVGSGDAQLGMIIRRNKDAPQFSRRVGEGKGWANTPDFSFVRWVTRCTPCYIRENRLDRLMEDANGNA